MASNIRVRAIAGNGVTTFKSLIRHPMDSGYVKDPKGKLIPAHYIMVLTVKHEGTPVFVADWGPAVSKDPYLEFKFKGGKKGDKLSIAWVDNKGKSDETTAEIM
ncbi:MAG: thiosulfate oxidation carrier complex protein SoxZ [Salinisphaera sp.]|nr:thiosulfate oxidation carrier complex protein SoxZ [Salinisphaera sp.]